MRHSGLTLIDARPAWAGIQWASGQSQIRTANSLLEIDATLRKAPRSMERVIVEAPLESVDILTFLSALPAEYVGDVLFINGAERAFLSATVQEAPRVLYELTGNDIDFYLDVHGLRAGVSETAIATNAM